MRGSVLLAGLFLDVDDNDRGGVFEVLSGVLPWRGVIRATDLIGWESVLVDIWLVDAGFLNWLELNFVVSEPNFVGVPS